MRAELARVTAKLREEHGTEVAISGLARGTDQWFADAAHTAELRVWGYEPCPDQDAPWTRADREERHRIIALADRVDTLAPRYTRRVMFDRNMWMLRDSDALVAVVDPRRTTGGTVHTIDKATGRLPLVRIDVFNRRTTLRMPDAAAA